MTSKRTLALVVGLTIALSVPSVLLWKTVRKLEKENEALRALTLQSGSALPSTGNAQKADADGAIQRQRDVAELTRLRAQIAALKEEEHGERLVVPAADASPKPTNPMTRMELGRELVRHGKYEEALQEYLWCFDEGAKDPAFAGVRLSFLLDEITSLAKELPTAREALISRRDGIESALRSGNASASALLEYARLNSSLGESNKTLEMFDQLPQNSPDRNQLVRAATSDFLAAQRYRDIVEVSDPAAWFFQRMSLIVGADTSSADQPTASRLREVQLQSVLNVGGDAVEALAGAGQSDRAKTLADKVLTVRNTPETLNQLIRRAERSGNPEVTEFLKAKAGPP